MPTAEPAQLAEIRKLARTLTQCAIDVFGYFDRPGTSNGPTEAITGASSTFVEPPSASGTSRTTSPAACSKPEDSDPDYTLNREEPDMVNS